MKTVQVVKSVVRAVEILELFSATRPRLTLNQLTEGISASRATAHRYASTLRHVNILRYDPASGEYALGPLLLTLGAVALEGLPIIRIAEPYLQGLVREVNETVVLSIWDGASPVVVLTNDTVERAVRVNIQVGARLAPFRSAQGMVFSAFLPEDEVPTIPKAERTQVRERLATVRETGIAINNSNVVAGFRTIAAPVFRGSRPIAAMAIVGTSALIPETSDSEMGKSLLEITHDLSDELASRETVEGVRKG